MITKFLKRNYILILILLLAAFLRLYRLNSIPPSLHWDETAIGYNAYSILKTGRDEYGNFLPLIFKSFGDYKPGLYVYLTVPFVVIFGLNEFSVRLPSALIGIATVWLLYQVVCQLFPKQKTPTANSQYPISLLASFSLAVSPWHLQFSRGAWEANVALFLILLGSLSFLNVCFAGEQTQKKKKISWIYLSVMSFGLSLFAYQSSKMFVPLLIFGLLICFGKRLKDLPKKHLLTGLILLLFIATPVYFSIFSGGGGRLKVMSLFSYPRTQDEIKEILRQDNGSQLLFQLFHSEPLSLARGFLERYFNHFSGRFLFFEGDWSSLRHGPSYMGVLYYFDFFLLLFGVYWLIRQNSPASKFIWFWLLVAPLPSALSRDQIQATRSLNMILPLAIIIGCGLYQIYLWLKEQKKIVYVLCSMFYVLCYIWCFSYYLDQYYIHYPIQSSQYWQYGYKNVVNKIYPISNNYSKIIFTPKYGQPYIYWLFYTQYDPQVYQQKAQLKENLFGDVGQVEKLDNIEFRPIFWPSDRNLTNVLLIGDDLELPLNEIDLNNYKILEEIKFLNGQVAFRMVETP